MVRVRFAPSPTGSLHVGSALAAVANRSFADRHGGRLVLRIDDTDARRAAPEGEEGILRDLDWLGVRFDEGPMRQSERADEHRAAARRLLDSGRAFEDGGAIRFDRERRPTLVRADGRPTYHLASAVDDLELGITHVIRGKDQLANTPLHVALIEALGGKPPEFVHHGLIVGEDGQKLSKRHGGASVGALRQAGIPPDAVREYLEELGLPRGDVHFDFARIRRLAVEAIARMSDDELARRAGAPVELAPALRGARDLKEAREYAAMILRPPEPANVEAEETLARFRELRTRVNGGLDPETARSLVRELKAVGGDLRALRVALTGSERGPELWTIIAALPLEETLRRIDAAL